MVKILHNEHKIISMTINFDPSGTEELLEYNSQ